MFDGLVEDVWEERDDGEAELSCIVSGYGVRANNDLTHPDRSPRPHKRRLRPLERAPRVLHNGVNRERGQPHTRQTLKHRALRHDGPVILADRDLYRVPRRQRVLLGINPRHRMRLGHGRLQGVWERMLEFASGLGVRDCGIAVCLCLRTQHRPVLQIRFVPLVRDVAEDVRPGDAVRAAHDPRVGNGSERLAYVGGVGDIAVGGEEEGAYARGVTCVAVGGVEAVWGTVDRSR